MIGSVCAMHPSSSWLHHRQGLLSSTNAPRPPPPSLELRPSFPSSCTFKLLVTLFSLICIVSFPTFYSSFQGYFGVARSGKYFSETKVYGLFSSAYKANRKIPPFRREAWLGSYGEFSKLQTNVSDIEALKTAPVLLNVGFCDYNDGKWIIDPTKKAQYSADCPFTRNSWRCAKNQRPGVDQIVSWRWIPKSCSISSIDGLAFLNAMKNRRIGFIGDSLNENFMVALLCTLRAVDTATQRWKRRGAWKGAFFPSFNVTIGYHRAVLLAEYSEWQPKSPEWPLDELGVEKAFRVDADIPANSWVNVTKFYDVLIFNTGHWWSLDKFPPATPLLFYKDGKPLVPFVNLRDGLEIVLKHMIAYVEKSVPPHSLKLWRTQSPRHFHGGDWNQNGSCLSNDLLTYQQVETWFEPKNNGVNREVREINQVVRDAVRGTSFQLFDVTHISEFRADAHPAIWLGKKDAHITWGQDCLHWCLPGLPDTWVDVLAAIILDTVKSHNV